MIYAFLFLMIYSFFLSFSCVCYSAEKQSSENQAEQWKIITPKDGSRRCDIVLESDLGLINKLYASKEKEVKDIRNLHEAIAICDRSDSMKWHDYKVDGLNLSVCDEYLARFMDKVKKAKSLKGNESSEELTKIKKKHGLVPLEANNQRSLVQIRTPKNYITLGKTMLVDLYEKMKAANRE